MKRTVATAASLVLPIMLIVSARAVPSLDEVIASKEDLWADAALAQSNGPTLEFFKALLPPLHYVNADFRHYPIVLSAPKALKKSRLCANGSGINLLANTRAWNEIGTPILFRVGPDEEAFGEHLEWLTGPAWENGYMPVVQLSYHHGTGFYYQETFASVDRPYSSNAVSLTQFRFKSDGMANNNGHMAVRLETAQSLRADGGRIVDAQGKVLLWFNGPWQWRPARHSIETVLTNGATVSVGVPSVPVSADLASPIAESGFEIQHQHCLEKWQAILDQGMSIEVPEAYVNNAWRSLIVADFSLLHGDAIFYSAGNQYERLYSQEGAEAALAMMAYGYEDEMRRMLPPLLDFTRKGLEQHQAGRKLEAVCRYFWQTHDTQFVKSIRPRWQKEIDLLARRRSDNGLYPREQYCGDISTPVYALNADAEGWRALRDSAAMLKAIGDIREADRLQRTASDFRKTILDAVQKSVDPKLDPPFIPNALLGEEKPYDVVTASRLGGYWNLMANNILGTELFGQGSDLETGMLRYFQQHGALCMGLIRVKPWPAFWVSTANLNPLYGWPYVQTLLRRDEADRALVSFYGMLAAGFTPDTFVCGEGCALEPVDKWGRQFYCPPNSAGNAFWLQMLRNLLVQDWDLDQDGEPETLRLLFATPRQWLADGNVIQARNAPTAFGPVSLRVASHLSSGTLMADVNLPDRTPPQRTELRIRLPEGWEVISAAAGERVLPVDKEGAVNLSSMRGKIAIVFKVGK